MIFLIAHNPQITFTTIIHKLTNRFMLDHILSLEPSSAELLKTRAGIKNWLNRFETFDTFRFWTKRNAREMLRIIDNTPITYIDWVTYVANSESVISHIEAVLKEIQQASEEENMDYEDLISNIDSLITI